MYGDAEHKCTNRRSKRASSVNSHKPLYSRWIVAQEGQLMAQSTVAQTGSRELDWVNIRQRDSHPKLWPTCDSHPNLKDILTIRIQDCFFLSKGTRIVSHHSSLTLYPALDSCDSYPGRKYISRLASIHCICTLKTTLEDDHIILIRFAWQLCSAQNLFRDYYFSKAQ
jgi:hypothetical protein